MEAIATQEVFIAIVASGIIGAVVVSVIIITYTIIEFKRKEIW